MSTHCPIDRRVCPESALTARSTGAFAPYEGASVHLLPYVLVLVHAILLYRVYTTTAVPVPVYYLLVVVPYYMYIILYSTTVHLPVYYYSTSSTSDHVHVRLPVRLVSARGCDDGPPRQALRGTPAALVADCSSRSRCEPPSQQLTALSPSQRTYAPRRPTRIAQ